MPNTIFIALQCCQCSIMQVKQMKKSSTKWTCVVCNQKQSVRKVFAQGYMAKDLRRFVQSFNISRSREPEQGEGFEPEIEIKMPNKKPKFIKDLTTTTGEAEAETEGDNGLQKTIFNSQGEVGDKKPGEDEPDDKGPMTIAASKWSNYMTPDDKEPTTCKSKTTNASSKWSSYMTQDDIEPSTCRATMTMAASKWNNYITQDDMEPTTYQPKMTKAASKHSNYMTKGDINPRALQATMTDAASKSCDCRTESKGQRAHLPTVGKTVSKWSNYLTQDENELQPVNGRKYADHSGDWSNGVFETTTHDQKVEDDIHPDFV